MMKAVHFIAKNDEWHAKQASFNVFDMKILKIWVPKNVNA